MKSQESSTINLINKVVSSFEEWIITQSSSYKYEVKALQDVARERHEIFENLVNSSKVSIKSKLKEFSDWFSKEVTKLKKLYESIKDKVDVLMNSSRTLIEDLSSFNKDYIGVLKIQMEADDKLFTSIEKSPTGFHEKLSKFDFLSTTSISQ